MSERLWAQVQEVVTDTAEAVLAACVDFDGEHYQVSDPHGEKKVWITNPAEFLRTLRDMVLARY